MRRHLPADQFDFVELVERGRPDWLASACSRRVACDVLVVSGHYDGGKEFFADSIDKNEYLPIDEMERVACSDSCPALFSHLKEVYLFGCNTLNPESVRDIAGEVGRSLSRSGRSRAEIDQLTRVLAARHAESSRDRMRLIFKDVPAIYGFSSVAPLGPVAASTLGRYLVATGSAEIGSGRQSSRLISHFAGKSMVVTSGLRETEPQAAHRRDVCRLADDRLSVGERLAFVHELVRRDMAEVRMFLDRIDRETRLSDDERAEPEAAAAIREISGDDDARARYFAFMEDVDRLDTHLLMVDIARRLGWLSAAAQEAEVFRVIGARLASGRAGPADVDVVCGLNSDRRFDGQAPRLALAPDASTSAAASAIQACMGEPDAHARVLRGLTAGTDDDARIAQVYLRHRPLADVADLRNVMAEITRMSAAPALARALDALASSRLSDPPSLDALARLYPVANTADVQSAIAGILIRSDYDAIDRAQLAQTLRQHRLKARPGDDLVDALIRRLETN